MPALQTTSEIAPRSALRHRPIHAGQGETIVVTPIAQRAHRPRPAPAGQEEAASPGSATDLTEDVAQVRGRRRSSQKGGGRGLARRRGHPLLFLGLGMLLMLALWVGLTQVINWAANEINTLTYGYPRTFQVDAFVGHNESAGTPSHFLAINLRGRLEVVEMPGGDAAHARIYVGPQLFGPGADLVPVTLTFVDVNGDHRPDMILIVAGTRIVFINDQGGFRPLKPDEQGPVQQWLKLHEN